MPFLFGVFLLFAVGAARAEPAPVLWGYGGQSCARVVQASDGLERGNEAEIVDYGRFQEWVAGFVSGINLASGRDVLNGMALSVAMQRIEAECREDPRRDLFSAATALVRASMQFDQLVR